jgi:hypothetical protein
MRITGRHAPNNQFMLRPMVRETGDGQSSGTVRDYSLHIIRLLLLMQY